MTLQVFRCWHLNPRAAALSLSLLATGPLTLPETGASAQTPAPAQAPYQYTRTRGWLRMPDGVRLAVTYWRPVPRTPGERFPVLLEYLPYRKEDSFYERDFPLYDWFVRRGFIMAKVDIRGTGSSEGHLPDREYSDIEMEDADRIIAKLALLPGSNGAIGIWGISWGGFNAIQIAMRHPPALKAIIALMATDDLYHDDIHYIDGVLHIDEYALQIDHENALPAPPDYPTRLGLFPEPVRGGAMDLHLSPAFDRQRVVAAEVAALRLRRDHHPHLPDRGTARWLPRCGPPHARQPARTGEGAAWSMESQLPRRCGARPRLRMAGAGGALVESVAPRDGDRHHG